MYRRAPCRGMKAAAQGRQFLRESAIGRLRDHTPDAAPRLIQQPGESQMRPIKKAPPAARLSIEEIDAAFSCQAIGALSLPGFTVSVMHRREFMRAVGQLLDVLKARHGVVIEVTGDSEKFARHIIDVSGTDPDRFKWKEPF